MQACAGRLPEEKGSDQDRERDQMPAEAGENAERDHSGDRQVNREKPGPRESA